jgi:hypothetical protein
MLLGDQKGCSGSSALVNRSQTLIRNDAHRVMLTDLNTRPSVKGFLSRKGTQRTSWSRPRRGSNREKLSQGNAGMHRCP